MSEMSLDDRADALLLKMLADDVHGWWVAEVVETMRHLWDHYVEWSDAATGGQPERNARWSQHTIITGALLRQVERCFPDEDSFDVMYALKDTGSPRARALFDEAIAAARARAPGSRAKDEAASIASC